MPVDVFANDIATSNLTVAVVTTPVAGTSEVWTVVSTASFSAIGTGGTQQFRATVGPTSDTNPEIVIVTAINSATTMTVTRGAEGSAIKTHAVGDPVNQTITAGALSSFYSVTGMITAASGVSLGSGSQTGPGIHSDGTNTYVESGSSSGNIVFRPKGPGVVTSQVQIDQFGDITAPGAVQTGLTGLSSRFVGMTSGAPTYASPLQGDFAVDVTNGCHWFYTGTNGWVPSPGLSICSYYRNGAWNTVGGSIQTFTYDVKIWDTFNVYNNTTGVFTAPWPGIYKFTLEGWANSSAAGQSFQMCLGNYGGGTLFISAATAEAMVSLLSTEENVAKAATVTTQYATSTSSLVGGVGTNARLTIDWMGVT